MSGVNQLTRAVYRWRLLVALGLAIAVVAIGRNGSFVAGGADSYCYISEAALWLDGNLHVRHDAMVRAPWPNAADAFAPLGYIPARTGAHIVPVHAPGLPLLMAGAQLVGGRCAMFWVVPLLGGVLVLATYAIGARVGRPIVGLAAAWLVATSPAVLVMLANPMSDLPAAAAWALAVACVLGPGRPSAFAAGLAAAVGILIRPNLVPVAGPFVLYTLYRDATTRPRALPRMLTPWFLAAVSIGIIIEGAVNASLYGSPFVSGYGRLDYSLTHVWPNLRAQVHWLSSTQTPLVLFGILSLALPLRRVWTTPAARRTLWFLALYAASVWVPFLLFTVNDAWWYLRYLLPMWPVIMLGTAACLAALYRTRWWWARLVVVLTVVALGWHGWAEAGRRGAFDVKAGEQKYIDAAEVVKGRTAPESAVLSVQHSGSVRYYAGRMTLRWDAFPRGYLDQAVEWLNARGHRPYLLVEPWEVELFRARFGESDVVGRLDWAPVVKLDAASTVYLYDLADRTRQRGETEVIRTNHLPPGDQCLEPAKPLPFTW